MDTPSHPVAPPGPSRRPGLRRLPAVIALATLSAALLPACSTDSTTSSGAGSGSGSTTTFSGSLTAASLEQWPTTPVSVTEAGSTLLQPLFAKWATAVASAHPTVTVASAGGGSGQGIQNAATGTSNIGASDAYLSPAERAQYPALADIPLAISSQQVNYNVPGVTVHLRLDGTVLAGMYGGTITNWDDPAVAKLNPGVSLPDLAVAPVHRLDSSGDTFLFSSFLAASDPTWGAKYPPNTLVAWPDVPGASAAQGNGGMVSTCKATPGCVAYIGISYLSETDAAGLGYAALENRAGTFELPTAATIAAEAADFASKTPSDGAISMIFGPATNGYPIVNYEYAVVGTQPDATHAQAVKAVLAWVVDPDGGSAPAYLDAVQFQSLPSAVRQIALNLISKISA